MNKKERIILVLGAIAVILVVSLIFIKNQDKEEFSVDTYLLKFVMKEEETLSHTLNIVSYIESDYSIEIVGLEGLYTLSENNFYLGEGEEKSVELFFDSSDIDPNVYLGYVKVISYKQEEEIPIILELQTRDVFFAVNLDNSYTDQVISPGDKISPSIRVYNLRDTDIKDVEMSYYIKDLNSRGVFTEIEYLVVGTDSTFTKNFYLPATIEKGEYVFVVTAETYGSFGTASYLFTVDDNLEPLFVGSEFFTYVFATSIVIFLFGIILLVFHTLKDRNKVLKELERLQSSQINKFIKNFEKKENTYIAKAKTKKNKAKIKKKYDELKKKEVKKIKVKQKKQKATIEKLSSKDDMENKIKKWKNQGFDVPIVKKTKNKESNLKKFKKEGYKV